MRRIGKLLETSVEYLHISKDDRAVERFLVFPIYSNQILPKHLQGFEKWVEGGGEQPLQGQEYTRGQNHMFPICFVVEYRGLLRPSVVIQFLRTEGLGPAFEEDPCRYPPYGFVVVEGCVHEDAEGCCLSFGVVWIR